VAIVEVTRLHRFMSSPQWSPEQREEAAELLGDLENTLEDALGGTHITPVPFAETARIVVATGALDTAYPVFAVTRVDGVAVADGDSLPPGYLLHDGTLRVLAATSTSTASTWPAGTSWVAVSELSRWASAWPSSYASGSLYGGEVALEYLAGWGPRPTLAKAILTKAAAIMKNRHEDAIVTTGIGGQPVQSSPLSEDWSPEELANLGRFRRLRAGGA
jgi:hypothetical protein